MEQDLKLNEVLKKMWEIDHKHTKGEEITIEEKDFFNENLELIQAYYKRNALYWENTPGFFNYQSIVMKKIKSVHFPQGYFEGSPCIITYEDGSTENTIADTAYMRARERKLSKEEMKAVGL